MFMFRLLITAKIDRYMIALCVQLFWLWAASLWILRIQPEHQFYSSAKHWVHSSAIQRFSQYCGITGRGTQEPMFEANNSFKFTLFSYPRSIARTASSSYLDVSIMRHISALSKGSKMVDVWRNTSNLSRLIIFHLHVDIRYRWWVLNKSYFHFRPSFHPVSNFRWTSLSTMSRLLLHKFANHAWNVAW